MKLLLAHAPLHRMLFDLRGPKDPAVAVQGVSKRRCIHIVAAEFATNHQESADERTVIHKSTFYATHVTLSRV